MTIELLSAKQLAELTGLKLSRVYELCRAKKIPFILIGERQYAFPRATIERWLGIHDESSGESVQAEVRRDL